MSLHILLSRFLLATHTRTHCSYALFAQTDGQTERERETCRRSEFVLVVASCPRCVHLSAQFEKAIWLRLPLRQIQQPRCKLQPKMQATGPSALPTLHCQFVCALKLLPNSGPKWPNSCNKIFLVCCDAPAKVGRRPHVELWPD